MNLINELFKPNVAGTDLIKSIVKMMNNVKLQMMVPDLMKKELELYLFKYKNITKVTNKQTETGLCGLVDVFLCVHTLSYILLHTFL